MRSFTCKCNSGKDVHNKVDPEELKDAEWADSQCSSAKDYNPEAGKIDGHLILNEFAAIVENITTPSDCVENGYKVVIQN